MTFRGVEREHRRDMVRAIAGQDRSRRRDLETEGRPASGVVEEIGDMALDHLKRQDAQMTILVGCVIGFALRADAAAVDRATVLARPRGPRPCRGGREVGAAKTKTVGVDVWTGMESSWLLQLAVSGGLRGTPESRTVTEAGRFWAGAAMGNGRAVDICWAAGGTPG